MEKYKSKQIKKKLSIPDLLTLLRIAGSVCLLFVSPLSIAFYVIYSLCGISDVMDGMTARATKSTSELGAKLDSAADLLFYSVMLLRILPILWKILPTPIWYAVGAVLFLRLCSYFAAALKHRCFAALHTYLNKLTGICVFFIPYFIKQSFFTGYCIAVCAVAGAASAEELIIHLLQHTYNPKVKTILTVFRLKKKSGLNK